MALGARSGSSAARHDVSNLALEVSPHYDMHAVALELTANTQQYTSDGVLLSLLPDPAYDVSVEPRGFGFSPSTGATIGDTPVTLYGTNLRGGSDYRVRYDGAEVNATYRFLDGGHDALLTITPPRPFEGVAQVTVTLNGQQYAYAGEFGYHAYPAITLFSPTTGPDLGGTQIRVSLPDPGAGLGSLSREWYGGSRLLCRFGHERAWSESGVLQETRVEAHPDPAGASQLLCRLPGGLARGFQALEVSLNGQEFSHSALNFTVYAQPQVTSLSPSSGPRGGATRVRVSGDSLSVGSHYLCGFGAAIVDAAVALGVPRGAALGVAGRVGDANFSATSPATDEVRCVSPSAANASSSSSTFGGVIIPLELSLNGQNYTDSEVLFSYYDDPIPLALSPSTGPERGHTRVTISGLALGTGSHYRVSLASFSAGAQTTLLVEASHSPAKNGRKNGTMGFVTPALPSADMQRVRVSLNAQQYSPVPGVAFVAYPHVALSKLSPRCGHGNTRVLIHGHTNLSAGSHLLCKLGGGGAVVVDATLVDSHTLACLVPPVNNGSVGIEAAPLEVSLNGQQYSADGLSWTHTEIPRVSAIYPTAGVSAGGVLLTLTGVGFGGGCERLCRFGGGAHQTLSGGNASSLIQGEGPTSSLLGLVNATYDPTRRVLLCRTPPATNLRIASVEVTLNAQQYTSDAVNLTYYDQLTVHDVRPLTTPLSGGTTVTLTGSGLHDFSTVNCRFGDDTIYPATHIDLTRILCVTPPLSALSPAVSRVGLQADFSSAPPELLLGGNAVVKGGVLRLTDAEQVVLQQAAWDNMTNELGYFKGDRGPQGDYEFGPKPIGFAVVELPPPLPALWDWRVSFELFIGGGNGGDGFSFVYGDIEPMPALEKVGGLTAFGHSVRPKTFFGLEISFFTRSHHHIRVMYNGTTLHVIDFHGRGLRTQAWVQVRPQRPSQHSRRKHSSPCPCSHLVRFTPPFLPSLSLSCSHASSLIFSLPQVDLVYDIDGLTIVHDGWTSWAAGTSSQHLQIPGWNPQRGWRFGFGASSQRWTDYHWVDNLVIWSSWLVFGPSPYDLSVTLNGQQFVPSGVNTTYLADPAISRLVPKTGPAAGGTQIRIQGVNLVHGDHYTCRFGEAVVPAELIQPSATQGELPLIQCVTPAITALSTSSVDVRVAVSLNNQDYTVDPIDFSYREPTVVSHINPDAGPIAGGSRVTVSGSQFATGDGFRCRFGDMPPVRAQLRGSFTLGYTLECYSPALNETLPADSGERRLPLEVTVNDQQYTFNGVPFRYFSPQSVDDILPTSGPVIGGTSVLVSFTTSGSSSDSTFYCRFGTLLSLGARVSNGRVACPSPSASEVGPVMLSISTNAQQFSNKKHFFYYAHPVVSVISPTSGPVDAGTLIDVRGAFLGNGSSYRCQFGTLRACAWSPRMLPATATAAPTATCAATPSRPMPRPSSRLRCPSTPSSTPRAARRSTFLRAHRSTR